MADRHSQAWLYRKRNIIKQELRPLKLQSGQKKYLKLFLCQHKHKLVLTFILLILTTVFEIAIPLVVNGLIKKYSIVFDFENLAITLVVFLLFTFIYLALAFFRLKYERGLIIIFINDLRRRWFKLYLHKPLYALKANALGKLLSKISYHFSLLQIGLSNTFFQSFYWLLLTIGLLVISFFIDPILLSITLILLPVNLIVFYLAHIISKYYVSQDQTMYTRILCFISDSLQNFSLIKMNHQEASFLKKLDAMVDIDSYFRVRRELWLKFGNKIIFVVLALLAAAVYVLEIYYPIFEIENSLQYMVYGIVFALLIKQIYLSLHIGLYSFPLKLGLALSSSEKFLIPVKPRIKLVFKSITFQAAKFRVSKNKNYLKNLKFAFNKGDRILITGPEGVGKTYLARIFAGKAGNKNTAPWIVKLDKKRFSYKKWASGSEELYIIDASFPTMGNVSDILASEKGDLNDTKHITKLLKKISKHPELDFISDHYKPLAKKINRDQFSFLEGALLQMAHCLVKPPKILVVDNLWLDLNSRRLNTMLRLLAKELNDTTIVCLATKNNSILKYDKNYHL